MANFNILALMGFAQAVAGGGYMESLDTNDDEVISNKDGDTDGKPEERTDTEGTYRISLTKKDK